MLPPLYISFHTPGGYTAEAVELRKTLDAFSLPADVRAVPPFASWVEACAHKSRFVQQMRAEYPGRPLAWLDADARVRQYPTLFDRMGDVDFAAHLLNGSELLSGTLYFAPTPAADWLIGEWVSGCAASPGEWDQKVLQRVVAGMPALKMLDLPPAYTWIESPGFTDDISRRAYGPDVIPVIVHLQASRRLKK